MSLTCKMTSLCVVMFCVINCMLCVYVLLFFFYFIFWRTHMWVNYVITWRLEHVPKMHSVKLQISWKTGIQVDIVIYMTFSKKWMYGIYHFVEKKTAVMLKSFFSERIKLRITIRARLRLELLLNDNEKSIAEVEKIKHKIILHLSTLQTLIR